MPKIKEILFGKKPKSKQLKTLTPLQEQLMALISEGLTKGTGSLSDIFGGFNDQAFETRVVQPELKHFRETVLPTILEKYSGGGQAFGSGMQNALLKAGVDLESKLAGLKYQAQQDAQRNRLTGLQTSLGTKGFENIYKQGTTGAVPALFQGISSGIGQAGGAAIAG
jgi:hypothetical protein